MTPKTEVLAQLDTLIERGKELYKTFSMNSGGSYESSAPEEDLRAFVTSSLTALERIAGKTSQYFGNIPKKEIGNRIGVAGFDDSFIPTVVGVLTALHDDVDQGFLVSLESRLRANIHDDFLAQANELLKARYHVAAIVIAGGVMENHLQQMATNRNLQWTGDGSIAKYNDLLKDEAYTKPIWRRIQAIGDLRNEAAHGEGGSISSEDAQDAISFAERFIADNPT